MREKNENLLEEQNFEVSISKEDLNALPAETFKGEIIVVQTEEEAIAAMKELEQATIIGFDTETKPAFQKGQINQVALLQLSTFDKCYLIRLCKTGMPVRVKAFLENDKIFKVGLSIKDDFHSLAKICSNIQPKGFLDLQDFVRKYRISDSSLTKIHAIVLGKRISKSQQLSNWEASTLTSKQMEYAALDAQACINIYHKLNSGEFNPKESKFYKEKCQKQKN